MAQDTGRRAPPQRERAVGGSGWPGRGDSRPPADRRAGPRVVPRMTRIARAAGSVLVPLGALAAGLSFFLPYVQLLRVFGNAVSLSGPRLGGALWIQPAAAVAILLVQVGLVGRSGRDGLRRVLVILGAGVGLVLCLAVLAQLHHPSSFLFLRYSAFGLGVRPAIGWSGSVLGFAAALLGGLL